MTNPVSITRNGILSLAICAGLGLSTLTTEADARQCMTNKSYGKMSHMGSYGPRYYPPMQQHGYGHHGHHGMYSHMKKHSTHGGYGHPGGYGQSTGSYGSDSKKSEQAPGTGRQTGAAGAGGPGLDIIETAAAAQNFNTLIRAAEAAGLYDVLRGDGPFTVFAPSDAAFENLPAGTVEALLADREKLTAVLTYHVVPERLTAADLVQQREFTTVQGQKLSLDKLSVASADIEASNGIIHVIDTVLIPEQ